VIESEKELHKGFGDLLLNPFRLKYKDIKYAYLIEFKYVKREVEGQELEKAVAEMVVAAEEQLNKYAIDDNNSRLLGLPPYGQIELKKVVVVFHGWEVAYCEELLKK
jgi:hypothetical protein